MHGNSMFVDKSAQIGLSRQTHDLICDGNHAYHLQSRVASLSQNRDFCERYIFHEKWWTYCHVFFFWRRLETLTKMKVLHIPFIKICFFLWILHSPLWKLQISATKTQWHHYFYKGSHQSLVLFSHRFPLFFLLFT